MSFDVYYVIMFFGRFSKTEGRRYAHLNINTRPVSRTCRIGYDKIFRSCPVVPEGRRRPASRYRRPGIGTYEVYKASEHHRSTSHSTTASPEWPRRRPSEASRHRTAKSRLRDGYACYRSRHGAHGSHVGRGSGTEAEIAPIRHFSCLDFASACPRDGPQKCSAARNHGIGSGRPQVDFR